MTQHTTTIIGDQQVARVEFVQDDPRWHRVLNVLWDEGVMATLSDRGYRVLGAFLRLRQEDGTAFAPPAELHRLTQYADRTIRSARAELTEHPRRLLAAMGSDRFDVLPGWSFAGRAIVRGTTVPEIGTTVPRPCAPHRERARASQPETETGKSKDMRRAEGTLAGWSEGRAPLLFGDADPKIVLIDLGLREPLLTATLGLDGLTGKEVARVAAELRLDRSVGNVAVVTADRLFVARGIKRPVFGRRAGLDQTTQTTVAALERLARARMQRSST